VTPKFFPFLISLSCPGCHIWCENTKRLYFIFLGTLHFFMLNYALSRAWRQKVLFCPIKTIDNNDVELFVYSVSMKKMDQFTNHEVQSTSKLTFSSVQSFQSERYSVVCSIVTSLTPLVFVIFFAYCSIWVSGEKFGTKNKEFPCFIDLNVNLYLLFTGVKLLAAFEDLYSSCTTSLYMLSFSRNMSPCETYRHIVLCIVLWLSVDELLFC